MTLSAFTKMCGAGNDFLITDEKRWYHCSSLKKNEKKKETPFSKEDIIRFCNRTFGIGADGLCYLQVKKDHSIKWDFFNNDGSIASMCGNASCCIIDYVYQKKLIPSSISPVNISIYGKQIKGNLDENKEARLFSSLPKVLIKKSSITLEETQNKKVFFSKIDSGVEHVLIDIQTLSFIPGNKKDFFHHFRDEKLNLLKPLSIALRRKEKNANITFYNSSNKTEIEGITFERGIENFTLACGTGALAIGYHFLLSSKLDLKSTPCFNIKMKGGFLETSFDTQSAYLRSPVYLIAEFSPYII